MCNKKKVIYINGSITTKLGIKECSSFLRFLLIEKKNINVPVYERNETKEETNVEKSKKGKKKIEKKN